MEAASSGSTAADNTDASTEIAGQQSGVLSDNQHIADPNPTQSLLDCLTSVGNAAAHRLDQQSTPKPCRRNFQQKPSNLTRIALAAQIKADIRLRFKLTDATFEQLPLSKTLAAVQILTKLATRTLKFGKQTAKQNELSDAQGKFVFSPFAVQAFAPQKTQLPHQVAHAASYEPVPELVNLSGLKQGGNILLAICHFYNVAVTRARMKKKIATISSGLSADLGGNDFDGTSPQHVELFRQRKLLKRLHVYLDVQFPKLITLFDLTSKLRNETMIAEMVANDFFLYILSCIIKHDVIKEDDATGRIDLSCINDLVMQAKREISGAGTSGARSSRPAHLRNASLNAIVSCFIIAYVKMERNFFRECRVRARLILLRRVCCLALLVKFKLPGYSVEFTDETTVTRTPTHDSGNHSPQSPADGTNAEDMDAEVEDHPAWFEEIPKTKSTDRVKLTGFNDCILGAEQGFPQPLPSYTEAHEKSFELPKSLRDSNRNVFKKYQAEHPEFTVTFKFVKFVVSAPNSNDVLRWNEFATAPTVRYTSEVDLLVVARDYLVQLLGCTSWPQLLAIHEKVMYSVITFARTLLAITRDYIKGPSHDGVDSEAPQMNDKAHMQMFFNTTNAKDVRSVRIGNVAGVLGLKRELPEEPEIANPCNAAFIGTLHNFFDTKALKCIAAKICIGRKEYDNGVMDGTDTDDGGIDKVAPEPRVEEPSRKRIRITFDDDSEADDSA